MQTKDILKKVTEYISPFIAQNNYEIVDLEYLKEGSNYYLRIFVDKKGGFTINDCEVLSRYIEKLLDKDDIIQNAYILEVCSPGAERPLKKESDFLKYKGRHVYIKLYSPINNQKEFEGELLGLIDNQIVIKQDDEELKFNKKDVAICRLCIVF